MRSFVKRVITAEEVATDIKGLIPDAGMRRRMSRVIKMAVSTAVECVGGVEGIDSLDSIVTATGWGCLADSERFLRNVIAEHEQLLNPTPFIQSTFNTVGGQIALLRHNHCYNVTYVNRSHSFEDALLDVMLRQADGESHNALLGAFDEQTPSQHRIMERMGAFRRVPDGEGAVFALMTDTAEEAVAQVAKIEVVGESLTREECNARYASTPQSVLMYNDYAESGNFPTASAYSFARGVKLIEQGASEVVIYNEYLGGRPTVVVLQCVG